MRNRSLIASMVAIALAGPPTLAMSSQVVDLDSTVTFDIAAQPLSSALVQFAKQSNIQVLTASLSLGSYRVNAVRGAASAREVLIRMLEGTGLRFEEVGSGTVSISAADTKPAVGASADDAESGAERTDVRGIPEVLVSGSRLLNMDVVRTRDDAQPYQILESAAIERSNAVSVENFLKRSVSANTAALSKGQLNVTAAGNASEINLRNLGTQSTLILINGRRAIGAAYFGGNLQADVNTIPLAAIERIEVLPSAASAIYGGAAMGGVVNVVLKQKYDGGDARVRYENTFDADAPIRSVDLSYGTSFEEGRSNVLLTAHYSDTKWLVNADRPELMNRGYQRVLQNSPELLYSTTSPFHVGTTPNISSTNGANLTLRDGTPLGAAYTYIPTGYSASSSPAALVANAGQYNLTLPYTADYSKGLLRPLGSAPRVASVMAVARREMTGKLELFTEFSYGVNSAKAIFNPLLNNYVVPASAPTNPFGQSVRISIPDNTQNNPYETEYTSRRAVLGFIYELPGNWKLEGDYTWNQVKNRLDAHYARINNALAVGAINPFVDTLAYPLDLSPYISGQDGRPYFSADSYLHDVGLRFFGEIGRLPAGAPVLTVGLGYRKEGMDEGRNTGISPGALPRENFDRIYFPQSQFIYSIYAESLIPLVSAANRVPGVHDLDLQLAVRSERYTTDTGTASALAGSGIEPEYTRVRRTSTNYTAGLRYGIVDGVTLRASFSTAFLPPTYSELLPGSLVSTTTVQVIDPRRGNSTSLANVLSGGNPDLEPTETDNINLGLILEPAFAPGLRLTADWFQFKQDNVIVSPTVLQIVNNESLFPSRVSRETAAPGDPYGVGAITLIDQRLINGTRAEISGIDFGLSYAFDAGAYGNFQFASAATLFDDYKIQTALGTPLVQKVNQVADNGPLRFKANASLSWDLREWSAGWLTYYYGSYDQYRQGNDLYVRAQGGNSVPSQVFHDMYVGYRFAPAAARSIGGGLLDDVSVQLGVKNVFDKAPAFDAFYSITAYYSPFGDPRMRSYSLSVAKSF
jgi:outer membrane receptor protein involved in Fe transport